MKKDKLIPKRRFKEFENDEAWEQRKLGDILKYEQPTKYIVESTDYNDSFSTPVLTAGQSFILGYTDETDGIKNANTNNPVIIFDDFTTSSHYVDFPFKIKSSAMKLLTLKDEAEDFYFIYNVLKNIKYLPQSHERHWISKFSEFTISVPVFDEQAQIGTFFKNIDNLITLHQRKLKKLKKLKLAYLSEMFPGEGEKYPKRRFAGFTDPWEQRKVEDLGNIVTGSTPLTSDVTNYGGDYLFVSPADIQENRYVENTITTLSEKGFKKGRILKEGSTLFVSIGSTIGKVAQIKGLATTNQQINSIEPTEKYNDDFVYSLMKNKAREIKLLAATQAVPIINKTLFSQVSVTVPSNINEQERIGSFFKDLDNLITLHQRKLEKLENLKKAYLNEMFV